MRGKKMTVAEYATSIGAVGYDNGVKMIEEAEIDAVDIVVPPKFREPLLMLRGGFWRIGEQVKKRS